MKKIIDKIKVCILLFSVPLLSGCMKEFLEIKRDKSQVVPTTIEDYQAILDHHNLNYYSSHLLGEIGSDDYYISEEQWHALSDPVQKNAYVWANEIYQGAKSEDWNRGYEKILYANFVLEGVAGVEESVSNQALRNEVLGSAFYHRGMNLFLLAQLFCKQYNSESAGNDLGLPLRTTSNINVTYQRATLEQTYTQIIKDLEKAARLLPDNMSVNTRPWKAAAWGMLCKVYLQRADYGLAVSYADSTLLLANTLLDYKEVDTTSNVPFARYGQGNPEIIYYSHMPNAAITATSRLTVDSVLYSSYEDYDLRKGAFFTLNNGRRTFKGHYSGVSAFMFSGLTTAEILLIRAESNIRLGKVTESIADLNMLLRHRFNLQYHESLNGNIQGDGLLELVLSERRRELVYRGLRWHDLKRYANEEILVKPLKRILGSAEYTLPIGSPKWVWPIPPDAVDLGKIIQNDR